MAEIYFIIFFHFWKLFFFTLSKIYAFFIKKKEIDRMVAPDKKTLKKSVKSMFFMVQTRCEVETIKY